MCVKVVTLNIYILYKILKAPKNKTFEDEPGGMYIRGKSNTTVL